MKFYNEFQRPFEELDLLEIRIAVKSQIPNGCGFSVKSNDGHPMFGFVSNTNFIACHFIAEEWET